MVKKILRIKDRLKRNVVQKLKDSIKTLNNNAKNNANNYDLSNDEKEKGLENQEINYRNKNESIKDHYFTYNQKIELFTILYTSIIFKWIQMERVNKLYNIKH